MRCGGGETVSGRETRPLRESQGCGGDEIFYPLSQKSEIFDSSPRGRAKGAAAPEGEPRRCTMFYRAGGGTPPLREDGGRIRRGVVQVRKVLLHTSSVTSGDSFSSRRSLRRCRASATTSAPISQIGTKQNNSNHGRSPYRNLSFVIYNFELKKRCRWHLFFTVFSAQRMCSGCSSMLHRDQELPRRAFPPT